MKEANKLKKEKLEKLKEQVQDDKGSALELVFKRPKNGHEQPWLLVLHEDGLAYLKARFRYYRKNLPWLQRRVPLSSMIGSASLILW